MFMLLFLLLLSQVAAQWTGSVVFEKGTCSSKKDFKCLLHCTVTLPSGSTHQLRSNDIAVYKAGDVVEVPDGRLNNEGVYSVKATASDVEEGYSCFFTDTSNNNWVHVSNTVTLTKPPSSVTVTVSQAVTRCVLNGKCKISCDLSGLKKFKNNDDKIKFYQWSDSVSDYELVAKQAKVKLRKGILSWDDLPQSAFGTYLCEYDGVKSTQINLVETPMCLKPTITGGKVRGKDKIGNGESYTVKCDKDKTLAGSDTILCTSGVLATAPTCTLTPMCSKPTIAGGNVKGRGKIGEGDSYTVKCLKGNTLTGSDTMTCSAGVLSTAPTCTLTPMCSKPTIAGGKVRGKDKIGDGDSYTVKCDKDKTLAGSDTILCTSGVLATAPTCTLTPMCTKPTISDANVEPRKEKIGEGEEYTITCSKNYVIAGSPTMTCVTGVLSTAPTCTKPVLSVTRDSSTVACIETKSCVLSCSISLVGLVTKKKFAAFKKSDGSGGYKYMNRNNVDVTADVMTLTFSSTKEEHEGSYVCEYEFDGKKETSGAIEVTYEEL